MGTASDKDKPWHWYRYAQDAEVPADTCRAAAAALKWAAKDLRIPLPRLRWILLQDPAVGQMDELMHKLTGAELTSLKSIGPISGRVDVSKTDEILVLADLKPDEAARTVAHECRHVWQVHTYGSGQVRKSLMWRETDARAYEARAAQFVSW